MTTAQLKEFWQALESRLPANSAASRLPWRPLGGKGRALGARTRVSRVSYRFVIRRGDVAAIELQIDSADAECNMRNLAVLTRLKREIETQFGSPLDWDADRGSKTGRRRTCVRYWIPNGGVPAEKHDWVRVQKEMIEGMGRLIATLDPYLLSLEG